MYYSKIDNSVSSPQLGYHCLFVNIPLYVIVFGYGLFIDLFFCFFKMIDHCLVFISIKLTCLPNGHWLNSR